MVRYDEPFTDPAYLAGRLVEMGVLAPGVFTGGNEAEDVLGLFG